MPRVVELLECAECGMREWHEFNGDKELSFEGDLCYKLNCKGTFDKINESVLVK